MESVHLLNIDNVEVIFRQIWNIFVFTIHRKLLPDRFSIDNQIIISWLFACIILQKLNGSIQNNLNSGINQPYNDQLDPQTMNNDTNSINCTHDICKLNGSSSISRINNNNSFRKSFSSSNLPSSSSSSSLSTSIIKNKFDQLNTNLIQPNESLNHSYGSYQYQQQSVSNSTLNCNSNEQCNLTCFFLKCSWLLFIVLVWCVLVKAQFIEIKSVDNYDLRLF